MATEAQWIDVNERMPEPWQVVLVQRTLSGKELGVRVQHDMIVAYLYRFSGGEGMEFRSDLTGSAFYSVSHWMPLPAPPTAARKG